MPTIGCNVICNTTQTNCTTFSNWIKMGGNVLNNLNKIVCVLCQNNSVYDPIAGVCECTKDYFRDENNNCISFSTLCKKN